MRLEEPLQHRTMASSTWASCKEESAAEVRNEDPPSPEGYAAYLKNSTRLVISEIVQLRDVFGPGAFNSPGCLGKRCEFGGHESETEPLILYLPGRIERREVREHQVRRRVHAQSGVILLLDR